jgi:hypothetical protein
MRTPYAFGTVAAVALSALFAACDSEPKTSPSTNVTRVEIVGPSSIAPGQTANYSLVEYLSNGSTRALPHAAWSSTDKSLVEVTSSGVATAANRTGETIISVRTTRDASKEVMVLPAGTFRLLGTVTDADRANVPIPNALVEVPGGPSARTNNAGQYRLYGVPADAEIRVTREGYRPHEERVQLTGHSSRSFRLGLDTSIRNYSGNYTLTVQTSSICPGTNQLNPDLRRRQYEAVMQQTGSALEVRLTESRFAPSWKSFASDRFNGFVTPTGATFSVEFNYYYYYGPFLANISERLPDGSTLYIYGTANTSGSPDGLSGSFNGWFSYNQGNQWSGCQASTFALTPR